MRKKPANHNKTWTKDDDRQLKKLIAGNTPTGLIAHKLQRSEDAIYSHASEIGASLKPVNRSPYNRRKK